MGVEPPAWWAERFDDVVATLLKSSELAGVDWDTFALCVEVSEHRLATTGYRYRGAGPPVSTEPDDEIDDHVWELWDASRAAGSVWDVLLVRLDRASGRVAIELVAGEDAAGWAVSPETIGTMPEALRPRPQHFAG